MHSAPLAVLDVIDRWYRDPQEMTRLVRQTHPPRVTLPPQVTWALLGLLHYRGRKHWAFKMLKQQLPALVAQQREQKMVTIDEVLDGTSEGVLPGRPEWEYLLEGNLSFLTHRVTGEEIHLDVLNGPGVIYSDHFPEFLRSRRRTGPVEARLLELFPMGRGVAPALLHLRDKRLFHVVDELYVHVLVFEFCGVVRPYLPAVYEFLRAWRDEANRPTLAALIGDWVALRRSIDPSDADRLADIEIKEEESRQRWLSILGDQARGQLYGDLLFALAEAKDERLFDHLTRALRWSMGSIAALEIIGDDPAWRRKVEGLYARVAGRSIAPERLPAARYLARVGRDINWLLEPLLFERTDIRSAILLALEFAPQRVFEIVRLGLKSHRPQDRLTAAAILARLNTPRSIDQLLCVLSRSSDPDQTIECRAALRETSDPAAHEEVDAWEAEHPDADPPPSRSSRYMYSLEGGCGRVIREEMAKLAERVDRLRKEGKL